MENAPHGQAVEVDAGASLSSYLILGSIFLLLTLFGLYVAIRAPSHDLNFVYVLAGLLVFSLFWLRSIRLRVRGVELCYRTLFWTRRVNLSDIEKAETRLFGTSKGTYRALVIYPRGGRMRKPMRVNIKVFSREDLRRIFDFLGPKFQGPRRIGVFTDESV